MTNGNQSEYPGKELEAMSFAFNYHRWIVDELAPFFGQNVVEVGAGTGDLTAMLLQTDLQKLFAFEPASNLFPSLARNMQGQTRVTTINDFFRADLAVDVIDSVLYINVLEHIEDPHAELLMVNRALRPGGHLLLFVPALKWLFSEADKHMGHFRRYYKNELNQLVKDTGFSLVKAHYFDFAGIMPWYLNFVVLKNSFNTSGVALYDKLVVPLVRPLEKLIKPPIGKNVLLVARKD
jgi:SAM-dependent methyltransferase